MVEKTGKTESSKKTKVVKKEETTVVVKVKTSKKRIDGTKAAFVNAICLTLSLVFGVLAICLGVCDLTGWEFYGSLLISLFEDSAISFGILSVVCAVVGFCLVNKITDKKAFGKIWDILHKVFFGLGIFKAVDVISVVIYSLVAISPKSGVDQEYLWVNQFFPSFVMFLAYLGVAYLAKKIVAGKSVLVRIFGIVSIVLSVIGFLLVMIGLFSTLYGEKVEQKDYSDYMDGYSENYDEGIDMEDLYNFMNPFGF